MTTDSELLPCCPFCKQEPTVYKYTGYSKVPELQGDDVICETRGCPIAEERIAAEKWRLLSKPKALQGLDGFPPAHDIEGRCELECKYNQLREFYAVAAQMREALAYGAIYARQGFPVLTVNPPIYTIDEFERLTEEATQAYDKLKK